MASPVSGGLDEVAILSVNLFAAFVTFKGRRIEYVGDPCSAPGAFSLGLAEADHGAKDRGQDTADNHRNSEDCAKAGKAEHGADDEAHGRDDYTEEEAAEGTAHGRFFFFDWGLLLGLCWNCCAAQRAEAPRRRKLGSALGTEVGH